MLSRLHPLFAVAGALLCLSACGGGSSGSSGVVGPAPTPPNGPTPGSNSVAVSPSSLAFSGPGSAAQTFTVSSTTANAPLPTIDPFGCGPVVTISTSSTTLPATYTVTPTGNGVCTFVFTIGNRSATLGVNVGGGAGASFTTTANPMTFTLGGGSQIFTATASSGTLTADATSCNGIATVTGGGGTSPQQFTVTPSAVGSCTFSVVDGSNSLLVPVSVNAPNPGANAVIISPTAMSFASPYGAPQQMSISVQGQPGSISIDESSCIAASAKIAYLTLNGVAPGQPVTPPVTATVTPYGTGGYNVPGTGSCTINFTATNGASASLTVVVNR
jgi:hypothetical protein